MLRISGPDGKPILKCLDCDEIDPLKSPHIEGWTRAVSLMPPSNDKKK
jgi:hypothetical protein